jgi:hypothetical protein
MAAENVDGIATDAQARARNLAVIDGLADRGIGRACAFGSHVALSRESGQKVVAGGEGSHDGALRDGFLHGLQVFRSGVEEEVDVRVDKAGKKRGVAEFNNFGAGGARDFRADFDYRFARDQNFAGGGDFAGFDVEQSRRVEDDWVCSWSGLGRR